MTVSLRRAMPISQPFAIALHTTSAELGLALIQMDSAGQIETQRSQVWDVGRSMSTHLHDYLNQFMQPQSWSDLAFVAVANGPGSFTSTRIGVVTARTLAQQLQVPLFAVSALAAQVAVFVADSYPPDFSATGVLPDFAVQLPAQREALFTAIYRPLRLPAYPTQFILEPLLADRLLDADTWQQTLDTWPQPLQQVQTYEAAGAAVSGVIMLAHAQWLRGDRPSWTAALPFYGQSPV